MKNLTELEDDVMGTTDWRAWALTSNISFLLLLILVLILVSCGCWSQLHHRRVKNVDLAARLRINQLVDENWQQLLDLSKDVLDCRLEDGSFEFSTENEEKEKSLFKAVKSLMGKLPVTGGDQKTYLQRQLKRKAMTTFYDVRGVRRLSLLCDFIDKADYYSAGCWSHMKRSCLSKLSKCIKPESAPPEGLQISKFLLATTIVLPLLLVGADMVSDGGVLGQMWPYTYFAAGDVKGEEMILAFLFIVSILILFFSTVNLLQSNPLATLVRNARTTVMMKSRELERKDVPVPLDHLTRHDFSISESLGESSYQQVFQWLFYLVLVSGTVRREGTEAATDLTFWSLLPSSLLSTISLSLGQYKVHFLTADYSSSFAQKLVYLGACIGQSQQEICAKPKPLQSFPREPTCSYHHPAAQPCSHLPLCLCCRRPQLSTI